VATASMIIWNEGERIGASGRTGRWLGKWVGKWLGKWVSKWVSKCVG
jgi:hypothetical protein